MKKADQLELVCKEKHDICTTNEINVQDYQTKEKTTKEPHPVKETLLYKN